MLLMLILGLCVPEVLSRRFVHLSTVDADLYASPCPETFQYIVQNNVLQYGLFKVDCPDDTTIQLQVELSVGNHVQGYNGDLILASSKEETIQTILRREPIMYKLYFPRWYNYPPKITKVMLNGQLICQGAPIDIKAVRILTTINLHHTLKLNIPNNFWGGRLWDPPISQQITTMSPYTIQPFNPAVPRGTTPTLVTIAQPSDTVPDDDFHIAPSDNFSKEPEPPARPARPTPRPVTPDRGSFSPYGINDDQCGIRFSTNMLVANGRTVQKGEYPWLVAIFEIKSLGPEFRCGATLISHKHIITAGHCVKQGASVLAPDKIFMRIGEHNIHKWTLSQGSESRVVGAERIVLHEDYKAMSADGDVAMIILGEDVPFNKLIRPICMWKLDAALERIVGRTGTVVGWGKDENDNLITPEPKQIQFPIVSQEDCLRSHFTFREITSERTFCAGFKNGSGPCNGDSGGGFIMEFDGRWYLRGIVSMSIAKDRTCDFSQYFVFSDVTKFHDWIQSNL